MVMMMISAAPMRTMLILLTRLLMHQLSPIRVLFRPLPPLTQLILLIQLTQLTRPTQLIRPTQQTQRTQRTLPILLHPLR
jgi:hypothetical protein